MSRPKSIQVKITFVKSPDEERRLVDLVQMLARTSVTASSIEKKQKKSV